MIKPTASQTEKSPFFRSVFRRYIINNSITMRRLLIKNAREIMAIGGFCAILIMFVWTKLHNQSSEDRRETISAAVQRNSNLAVALEQYAIRTINNADVVLQLVKQEYETKGNRIEIEKLLVNHTIEKDFFAGVAIVDEKGNVIVVDFSIQSDTIVNVKDRVHFQHHVLHPEYGLYIGKPLFSRTLKKDVIPLTRRLNKPDGSFGGVVIVQVEPSVFTRFYAEANLRPHDIISLVTPDGNTYSRRTGSINSHGENISKSPLYVHIKKAPVNNYYSKDAINGIPTFFSYRKLKQYPIIATVGVSEQDILADYYERASRNTLLAIIISGLILLFSILVCTAWILRKKNIDQVKESEVRYRSVFENSLDAIVLMKPNGKIVAANQAACCFLGLTTEELHKRTAMELADVTDPAFEHLVQEGQLKGVAQGELKFIHSNGSRVIGEVASARYKNADGKIHCLVIIRDTTERIRLQKELADEQKQYQRKVTEQVIRAQEREREVIGRELHDNVNQVLTTVKLYLEMAIIHKETREELLPKSMQYVIASINEIRNLSRDLSAPTLGTKSLDDSITALLETVQSSSGLLIHFEQATYADNLTMDQKLALYRIVQEQLNNVIKHAKATEVVLRLSQTKNKTILTIQDNGQGFDTSVQRHGIGLNNIISRAKVFDGEVKIESKPGKGFMLFVSLPSKIESDNTLEENGLLNPVHNAGDDKLNNQSELLFN
jgi:PAS domain S-box-containing protein